MKVTPVPPCPTLSSAKSAPAERHAPIARAKKTGVLRANRFMSFLLSNGRSVEVFLLPPTPRHPFAGPFPVERVGRCGFADYYGRCPRGLQGLLVNCRPDGASDGGAGRTACGVT